MAKVRIEQDHEACIGCQACVSVCAENWAMGKDGKAKPKKTEVDDVGCNQAAADSCPVSCIRVIKQE